MFAAIYEGLTSPWARMLGATLGAGVAIKLMDDALDSSSDARAGRYTAAQTLGVGVVPYALWALAAGASLRVDVAAGLFFAAYAVGMAHGDGGPLPSGVPGWVEGAAALLLAVFGAGLPLAAAALCLMVFVQCVDDIADHRLDAQAGADNVVRATGFVETHFLGTGTFVLAVSVAPALTLSVLVGMAVIDPLFGRLHSATARNRTGENP